MQTLPIIRHASPAQILDACFHQSRIWHNFITLPLTENMRVHNATGDASKLKQFADWALTVGNGTANKFDQVEFSPDMCLPLVDEKLDLPGLVSWVFPNLSERCNGLFCARQKLAFSRALLTDTEGNAHVHIVGNNSGMTAAYIANHLGANNTPHRLVHPVCEQLGKSEQATLGKWLAGRAIMAPLNETVDELNKHIMKEFPGKSGASDTCKSRVV